MSLFGQWNWINEQTNYVGYKVGTVLLSIEMVGVHVRWGMVPMDCYGSVGRDAQGLRVKCGKGRTGSEGEVWEGTHGV